jgi:phage tail sheath protein FI
MPSQLTYPGVYIEEIKSGVRTITGVATSIAAFVGRTSRGPLDTPLTINSFADFERMFGGLAAGLTVGFAVRDFFLNGGSQAIVVRVASTSTAASSGSSASSSSVGGGGGPSSTSSVSSSSSGAGGGGAGSASSTSSSSSGQAVGPAAPATLSLAGAAGPLSLIASSPGEWGHQLSAAVDYQTKPQSGARTTFNLTIIESDPATGRPAASERFLNVSIDKSSPRYLPRVLQEESALVRVPRTPDDTDWVPVALPNETTAPEPAAAGSGSNGPLLKSTDYTGSRQNKKGIYALEKADIFNLLCLPPDNPAGNTPVDVISAAAKYCEERRAMLLVDPPSGWKSKQGALDGFKATIDEVGTRSKNAAIFFPRIKEFNPLLDGKIDEFVPCGAVAGVFARTDAQRGVWKAPAGTDATLNGVVQLSVQLTDGENGELNPLGINCLRSFPVIGRVIWGSRTLAGADILADEYKYIPVRRVALFIEESLFRGTQWVVFEPNDEPLWSQIRLNVGAFMHNLFRQGAFQGTTPRDAYFVKCDKETTTQNDINLGIVNIVVGFAPLKPAEFVVIKLQQMAGQIEV